MTALPLFGLCDIICLCARVHLKTLMITTDGFVGHHEHSLNLNYDNLSNIKNVIIDLSISLWIISSEHLNLSCDLLFVRKKLNSTSHQQSWTKLGGKCDTALKNGHSLVCLSKKRLTSAYFPLPPNPMLVKKRPKGCTVVFTTLSTLL